MADPIRHAVRALTLIALFLAGGALSELAAAEMSRTFLIAPWAYIGMAIPVALGAALALLWPPAGDSAGARITCAALAVFFLIWPALYFTGWDAAIPSFLLKPLVSAATGHVFGGYFAAAALRPRRRQKPAGMDTPG